MALTADRDVKLYASQELIDLPVDDNVTIYKGAFVGRNRATGYARPLVAGDDFLGIAYRRADNTVAGHTAGGINVRLHQAVDIVHALSGVTNGHLGQTVYASDDATLTLTPTANSRIGRVAAVEASSSARVRCAPVLQVTGVFEGLAPLELDDSNATLTLDHMNRVLLIANTAARVLTLPSAASARAGAWCRVVKTNSAAFSVVVDGYESETIDGSGQFSGVDAQYDTLLLMCTGSNWVILSRDIA